MKKPTIGLSLEGLPFIGLCAFAALFFAALGCVTMAVVFFILTVFSLNFFRDPERVPPADTSLAVAPADGKVIKVTEMKDPLSGEMRKTICIFMNVFNVHVNRMPVAGRIGRVEYIDGKFFNASFDKASEDNERNIIGIEDREGKNWTMVQIAGLVARRIICWAENGDELARGQRYGLIKFGSRVDLYLPDGYEPIVNVGDKVAAGMTAVAKKAS